mgnify:CR=1 FL=1
MTIAELFSAGSTDWLRVNSRLRTYWHTLIAVTTVPLLTVAAFAIAIFEDVPVVRFIGVVSIMVIMIFAIWAWVLATRRVRSIGYRLESRELKVSSGIMFRRVVSVPFARMQLVEVSAGPLERAFSLASVQLHTASASTDATIPGLDPERAAEIRDALLAERWGDAVVSWIRETGTGIDVYSNSSVYTNEDLPADLIGAQLQFAALFRDG